MAFRLASAMKQSSLLSGCFHSTSARILGTLLFIPALTMNICGCASGLMNLSAMDTLGTKFASLTGREDKPSIDDDDDNDFSTKIETPLLGDYISVTGNNLVVLRGVGLVTGLNGTGGDPPPSHLRKELLDEMTRREIPNPGAILASRNTALVIVTAYLPAMVQEGQHFDVRVALPPNSEATSLRGGWLLETRLSEEVNVSGRGNVKGHQYAMAQGAILTALGDGGRENAAMLRRGSIPGGAISNTERNLEVILRNEHRGLKTSKQIENAISGRLHHYDQYGQRRAMAEAKTDMMIELKVHPVYRNNFPRYQQMIRSIAFRESDVARRIRMERLSKDILQPEMAEKSALQLEAIGHDAIPFLKAALKSPELEVRFHAAQALAYMEDSSGVEVLKEAAGDVSAFRVYALAALSVVKDANGIMALRELLSSDNLETRYGAVRALKENSPSDTALGTVEFPGQFILHAIDSTGKPAAHIVRYRAPEVVIFGIHQEIRLPAVMNVGNHIRVLGQAGDNKVIITKYQLNAEPLRRTASTNLIEIIHAVADMGATYPDVAQMLLEAEDQHNLEGELGIDRLPQSGRTFERPTESDDGDRAKKARLGTPSLTPGLFDRLEEDEQDTSEEDSSALERRFAQADPEESNTKTDQAAPKASDEVSPRSETSPTGVEDLSLSEGSDPVDVGTMGAEKAEFREPVGSKMRRVLLGPFRKDDTN